MHRELQGIIKILMKCIFIFRIFCVSNIETKDNFKMLQNSNVIADCTEELQGSLYVKMV